MLRFCNLSYGPKSPDLVKNLSYDVPSGAPCLILGSNGSGKSTLARLLAGDDVPHEGTVLLDGSDLLGMSKRERARAVGFVAQDRDEGVVPFSVFEYACLGWYPYVPVFGSPDTGMKDKTRHILEDLGLGDKVDADSRMLSGGEFRLLSLARALSGERKILILDEADAALDFRNRAFFWERIRNLCACGMQVLTVTHDAGALSEPCASCIVIAKNQKPLCGPASEILTEENLRIYLGVRSRNGLWEQAMFEPA